MIKAFSLLLLWVLSLNSTLAYDVPDTAFHLVRDRLTVESTTTDDSFQLGKDTYLRQIYEKDNMGGWATKVKIVDVDNIPISDDVYQTSRKYFNRAVAMKFSEPLEVIDGDGKKQHIPAGVGVVRVNDVLKGNWLHYKMVMVNSAGEMIDMNGNVTSNPPIFRTSVGNYNQAELNSRLSEVIGSLVYEKQTLEEKGTLLEIEPHCVGCEDQPKEESNALTTSLRPIARPEGLAERVRENQTDFWNSPESPFDLVIGKRSSLKGTSSCESDRRRYEEELLDQTGWGHLSLDERADKIHQVAKESFEAIKAVSTDRGGSSNYANSVNANYLSPVITPELVTCIAFQETSGSLNPLAHNYTYCKNTKNMVSTAHGLGQMTRGTFRKMKNHPDSDQLPYSTRYSQSLQGKGVREAHQDLSRDPHLQLEVALRLLNFEAKYAKWKNPNASNSELLKKAITQYDHDNKSKYVKNVFDNCIPCMKNKSAKECYNETWD